MTFSVVGITSFFYNLIIANLNFLLQMLAMIILCDKICVRKKTNNKREIIKDK
jgi:hypothetical protein